MTALSSLFSSSEYVLYRFEYPEILFQSLRSFLSPALRNTDLSVLDLGCGTGLVTESFLKFYPAPVRVDLVDLDPGMLDKAKVHFRSNSSVKSFHCASSEKIPYPDQTFDLVLIGSAWHWMKQEVSIKEIERVLKPNGLVYIFEYQFPKSPELLELNHWIRIQFNTEWKPANQTPRGSLRELTDLWRSSSEFSQIFSGVVAQQREHRASELGGVIISQSRYQHYEQVRSESERVQGREDLIRNLDQFLKEDAAKFDYLYEGFLFKKRV